MGEWRESGQWIVVDEHRQLHFAGCRCAEGGGEVGLEPFADQATAEALAERLERERGIACVARPLQIR